jgi:hypothetical protein
MNNSDYLDISNIEIIENFSSGSGAVGQSAFGSGSVSNSRGPSSRSPSSNSQGGGKIYGSFGYASVTPSGAMSGISNPQPNSISGLGTSQKILSGAKQGSYSGGSFGGNGQYVIGFPGIKSGSNLPASSSPSLYMKPKLTVPNPTFLNEKTMQNVTLPYGHIEKHIIEGIPAPRITNKYDNVGCNFATKLRGPKFPYGVDLKDKNLTGLYNYRGFGYFYDPFYWGLGPFYPINGLVMNYPDIPYNYEDLMQKEINADYMVNTIQNQLATQFMEEDIKNQLIKKEESQEQAENLILKDTSDKKIKTDGKEGFESGQKSEQTCSKNNILIILAVVLILYILLSMATTETEKRFNLLQ